MTPAELLTEAFERVRETATGAVDGLTVEQLTHRPEPDANSIGWLVWHLARVQDDHIADVADTEQVWTARVLGPVRPAVRHSGNRLRAGRR